MQAFLEKLTRHLYAIHKGHLGELCLVLPNRRAALFIRKYLAGILEKTTLLPEFYAIEDFVLESSGQVLMDPAGLQFAMYDLHRKIQVEDTRSIEDFLPYATWMLSDFNEVDMYLVDPVQLFGYLSDVKAMSLWNPDGRPLNEFEKRYLAFMRSIGEYYNGLRKMLSQEGLAYQGMAFREMAADIETITERMKWHKVIFAGFNALTPAEEKILKHLITNEKAEVYWDADKYYTSLPGQEAGDFLRKYFRNLNPGPVMWEEDNFKRPKKIHVIGVPKIAAQVKYAGEVLRQLNREKGSLNHTALVLPDESLLIPVLNSIPEESGEFNVTMGLALKDTPLFTLLDNILNMHENAERITLFRGAGKLTYYSRDLIRIFNHPWFAMMEGAEAENSTVAGTIRRSGQVFINREKLIEMIPAGHPVAEEPGLLFTDKSGPEEILILFNAIIIRLRRILIENKDLAGEASHIELEYLYNFSRLFTRLHDLLKRYASISTLKTFRLVFRQMAAQLRIPFYGEPLKGLQVMGMLETRTLDFETLVMLSANEGIIPSARQHNSFIPHDIKKTFSLPTYQHSNKVFAYHFYRLLQRAEDIYLLYNTEGGLLGGAEKSRFITQLMHEAGKYNSGIEISEKVVSLPPDTGRRDTGISIDKSPEVMALIRHEAMQGFHPSSLSLYINCPLQFYLGRLLRIEELEEQEETIDNRVLGIIMHETLRVLMEKHKGNRIQKTALTEIRKELKNELDRQFLKQMQQADLLYGKNHIIVRVAGKMLDQMLAKEISWLGSGALELLELEKRYQYTLSLDCNGKDEVIAFAGTIDRIDNKDGYIRILDYKTGSVDDRKLAPGDWEVLFSDPDFGKAFQLMMYAWLFNSNALGAKPRIQAGILSLRKPGNGPYLITPPGENTITEEALDAFEKGLSGMISEIFDPAIPFFQTEDEKRCRYCSFKEMCNRVGSGINE